MLNRTSRLAASARARLLGNAHVQELAATDVDALVDACPNEEAIERLFEFGRHLLDALEKRNAAIESKATSLIGFSTAILALLATRVQPATSLYPKLSAVLAALVGIAAAAACALAFLTLRAAQNWKALGELSWFPTNRASYSTKDTLTRSYIQAMHQMLQENQRIVTKKADRLVQAQLAVMIAAMCLAIWFAAGPTVTLWRSFVR